MYPTLRPGTLSQSIPGSLLTSLCSVLGGWEAAMAPTTMHSTSKQARPPMAEDGSGILMHQVWAYYIPNAWLPGQLERSTLESVGEKH